MKAICRLIYLSLSLLLGNGCVARYIQNGQIKNKRLYIIVEDESMAKVGVEIEGRKYFGKTPFTLNIKSPRELANHITVTIYSERKRKVVRQELIWVEDDKKWILIGEGSGFWNEIKKNNPALREADWVRAASRRLEGIVLTIKLGNLEPEEEDPSLLPKKPRIPYRSDDDSEYSPPALAQR